MSWILLRDGSDKMKGACTAVTSHGDDIHIDREFIHRLGSLFMIESYQLRLEEIRRRI